jgi:CRISPR-associated endoribonuclease Cas6
LYFSEVTVTVRLKNPVYFQDAQEEIGKYLNHSMLLNNDLTKFHEADGYKFYVFSGLWPTEKNKTYQAGNVYIFKIRSLQQDFVEELIPCIRRNDNKTFQVLAVENKKYHHHRHRFIQEISTITPFVVTVDGKPWMPEQHDFDLLLDRLHANAEKKYKKLFGEEVFTDSFIQGISLLNSKPLVMHYKNISVLGHKARIVVNEDKQSQKLAFIVLGAGLAEKNSVIGAGFCHGKFV